MRKLILISTAAAGLLLASCADEGYYGYGGGYGGGYGSGYGYDRYSPSDVWYDGYYGPYSDGYWDGDVFFFSDGDGHFRSDNDGHFRHERFEGSRIFRSSPRHW